MLNKAQIIGRLGKEPEVRYTTGGDAVCNFSVATSEKWKDKATGEAKEETLWHRVTAFGRQAEIVGEYLKRGSLVFVEGKMTQRKYTDNKTGTEKVSHEIRMTDMKMLGGRSGEDQREEQEPRPAQQPAIKRPEAPLQQGGFDDMDDDIPF